MTLEKHLEAARIEYLRLHPHICTCDLEEYTGRALHNSAMAKIFEGLQEAEDQARLSYSPSSSINTTSTKPARQVKKSKTTLSEGV